ncbi:uncharacterized protein K460DRAFT_123077 [Cucurbitaria berberidis CBS 394.84]|uniref:Uncharacterized protein n=1 Tax=Cucurbitaria berberidis CBS 394.84 TaxID=1168544 RepID=A0A9P4GJ21_9PLEO|nr:uncharacterized protein K460DRAFT_123077 [Cucurbitaria berberidis CBS 394.84]KAF1846316.1 hypothetical protein K460DRAFT_123077 [Cucurbitaria berberidis CBS 394.84]
MTVITSIAFHNNLQPHEETSLGVNWYQSPKSGSFFIYTCQHAVCAPEQPPNSKSKQNELGEQNKKKSRVSPAMLSLSVSYQHSAQPSSPHTLPQHRSPLLNMTRSCAKSKKERAPNRRNGCHIQANYTSNRLFVLCVCVGDKRYTLEKKTTEQ